MYPTNFKKGRYRIKAHITPNKLNIVCDIAARFACVFPTDAAMFAVIVVPIFSPSTIAHAISKGIHPMLSMISVIAIVADDDCSIRVNTVPKARKRSTEPKPCDAHDVTNSNTSGVWRKSGTESFMKESPRNSKLNPTISSPIFLRLSFFEFENRNPKIIIGTARMEMSALNPNHETIQAVTVVPMLAPIITPMACVNVRSPAFTKLTTMTVVADEDCMIDVIPKPVRTPLKGFEVIADKKPLNLSPAAFCNPELIKFIP